MRSSYDVPVIETISEVDANAGFLCLWVYWQPDPALPNPLMPGRKQVVTSYIEVAPHDACLCGSGRTYQRCCRKRSYWHMICLNPDIRGYSLVTPQKARLTIADGIRFRERLMEHTHLRCVEDTPSVPSGCSEGTRPRRPVMELSALAILSCAISSR